MKKLYENLCFAISLMLAGSSFASENPAYQENSGRVLIPAVTADNQPGKFQDIELRFQDDDTLQMMSLVEGVLLYQINKVEVFQTNSFPVQVFLEVTGDFPSGCGKIGRVLQNQAGTVIDVSVYFENDEWIREPLVPCTLAMRPFKHTLRLDVYGLQAGTYQYRLNDAFSGSFTLTTDNRLPD